MNLSNVPRGSLFAVMLIVAGALLFLDNLGLLPIRDIRAYWPLWMVVWGVTILDRRRNLGCHDLGARSHHPAEFC